MAHLKIPSFPGRGPFRRSSDRYRDQIPNYQSPAFQSAPVDFDSNVHNRAFHILRLTGNPQTNGFQALKLSGFLIASH
jgi:hypothetical protein